MAPPTSKEIIEILKENLLISNDENLALKEKQINQWNESVEDTFEMLYDDLVDFRSRFSIFMSIVFIIFKNIYIY